MKDRNVPNGKEKALEMLAEVFDWLDNSLAEIERLYEKFQNVVINIIDALAQQMKEFRRRA